VSGRFQRLAETGRTEVSFTVDGERVAGLEGDTLMVAMLAAGRALRDNEFGDGRRAGFCLMGACQDCWVWTADGHRLRACTTLVAEELAIATHQPGTTWANQP